MLKPTLRRRRLLAGVAVALTATVAITAATVVAATSASAAATWRQVSVGDNSTCGIQTDGTLWCWGDNTIGKLGIGEIGGKELSPTRVMDRDVSPGTEIGWWTDTASVSVGRDHACALRASGRAYCWGSNAYGKLGLGTVLSETYPIELPGTWASISAGYNHTCGIKTIGTMWCWGQNTHGQLGIGNTTNKDTPTLASSIGWYSVTTGMSHTCGVTLAYSTYCWGSTQSGQVGTGIVGNRDTPQPKVQSPTAVGPNTRDWMINTAGSGHTCAIERIPRRMWCWGDGGSGQLGQGTAATLSTPQTVSGSAGDYEDWTSIDAGYHHTCAIRATGQLRCWGSNSYGQLGLGDKTLRYYATPVNSNWLSVSTGWKHTCAIRSSTKRLYCWGYNYQGQLGLGHQDERLNPTPVP